MGCGASQDAQPNIVAIISNREGKSIYEHWRSIERAASPGDVTGGIPIPSQYLVVHDNKGAGLPRLSIVDLLTGQIQPVIVQNAELDNSTDLEALFMLDKQLTGEGEHTYIATQSDGKAYMFQLQPQEPDGGQRVVSEVYTFQMKVPAQFAEEKPNMEGARVYYDVFEQCMYLEYSSRGGLVNGTQLTPWVARVPFDFAAVKAGTYEIDPDSITDITYWPAAIDGDPAVRQCADLGQAIGMAKYGQLMVGAYDDEENEVAFRSYIMERRPGQTPTGVENVTPLYKLDGVKIEAIMDLTTDVSLFGTDDEGHGASIWLLQRIVGVAYVFNLSYPEGADPRAYGISGIAAVEGPMFDTSAGTDANYMVQDGYDY